MQPQPINDACVTLVKSEEAFIPFVYDDKLEPRHAADFEREWQGGKPKGTLTIGYGTTAPRSRVRLGNRIARATADAWLMEDLESAAGDVARLVKVPLNENQFGALVSFTYNAGPGDPRDPKSGGLVNSTLLRLLNQGNYDAVPKQLGRFIYSDGDIMRGLIRRRANEAALWSTPVLNPETVDRAAIDAAEPGAPIVAAEVDADVPMAATRPDPVPDKTPRNSRTLWGTGGGLGATFLAILGVVTDVKVLAVLGAIVIVGAYLLIGTERIRRFVDEQMLSGGPA